MIKLKKILNEVLNEYIVQAYMLTDPEYNITEILEQIRAIRKVTIVRNITPEDYPQKENIELVVFFIEMIVLKGSNQD